jgi:GNAT superfamily N-acetyltransferase
LPPSLDEWWVEIHRKAVPTFKESDLRAWLAAYRRLALPDGILVATADDTQEPVATAGSLANSKDGMFPGAGQLGWVATIPEHRKRGLATWLSSLATIRLQDEGFPLIFLCTGEDMPRAIQVYLRLGYVPCLYASDQRARWARICETTGTAYVPDQWPTPEEYLSG